MDLVPALLAEKERVLAAGLFGRAKQIDVQLTAHGHKPAAKKKTAKKKEPVERADVAAPEQTVPSRPQRRPSR